MSCSDVGTVTDFILEPLPPDPRADDWLKAMETLELLIMSSFYIERLEAPPPKREPLESRTGRILEEV